ncbi:MAG: hypothetical protein WCA35_29220 [Kovacikia sp.]
MVGFIKRLFGSQKPPEEAFTPPPFAPKDSQKPEAFFLNADEAQSLGDLNYMRKAKAIRRTFPKTLDSPNNLEITVEVSSTTKRNSDLTSQMRSPESVSESPTSESPKGDEAAERRRTDTSMDMFRAMARRIKKP